MSPASTRCSACGQPLAPNARFCSVCGRTVGQPAQQQPYPPRQPYPQQQPYPPRQPYPQQQPISGPTHHLGATTPDERNMAMFCHLASFIGYLIPFGDLVATVIIWSTKKDQSAFVREHGAEALNYQISYYIYAIVSLVLSFVLIGFVMLAALTVFDVTVTIIAAIKASNGERYRYPLTIRFVQ